MKSVSTLLIVMLLVAGVAGRGSGAQPMPASSVAFQQCLGGSQPQGTRCQAAVTASTADMLEEWAAENAENPEFLWQIIKEVVKEAVRAGLVEMAKEFVERLVDRAFGASWPAMFDTYSDPTIFDPVS